MKRAVRIFIPFAVVITLLCGLVYVVAQQNYRQTANDPQIAYSHDISSSLNTGVTPQEIIPPAKIDMAKSLATFIMVFDNSNKLVLSTGEIGGEVPAVPSGVFAFVKKNGEDRITWAPQKETRIAAVVSKYKNGYVLVGRSLREIEVREHLLAIYVVTAWILSLVLTFASIVVFSPKTRNK